MKEDALDSYLRTVTPSEQWHLDHPGEPSPVYERTPTVEVDGQRVMLFDWKNSLESRAVGLIKETRFTTIPPHVNRDMELSYVYDGSCDFVVGGQAVSLGREDVIIFDPDVVRSSPGYKGEGDIVISMVFRKEFFDSVFLSQLPSGGMLTTFLFQYISRRRRRDRYLVIPGQFTGNAGQLMRFVAEECLFSDQYSAALLSSYMRSIFIELIRGLTYLGEEEGTDTIPDERVVGILDYIEHNYKECTLASTAREFGYSPNYLSNLLKERSGRTFSQIKLAQQMSEAAYLLLNSAHTVAEVARMVGISNMTYFYQKFSACYGMSPKEYRQAAGAVASPALGA